MVLSPVRTHDHSFVCSKTTYLTVLKFESYFTTGNLPPISLSCRQAPWYPQPVFFFFNWILMVIVLMYILSDKRMGLLFTIAAGPQQCSHFQVQIPQDSWPFLLSQIREYPNLEEQVPVFISPRNRVAQLYPQALGSLLVASYGPHYVAPRMDCIWNTISSSSSIVAYVPVAVGMCLPSLYLAVDISSGFTILDFSRHVTIFVFPVQNHILAHISDWSYFSTESGCKGRHRVSSQTTHCTG
jgi:hypothetical protein